MLVFRPVGLGQAGYYLNGPDPGRWLGSGCAALSVKGHPDAAGLSAVLGGRGPDGTTLLARVPTNRRAGFDLMCAAPKSVSLLAALAPPAAAAALVGAHSAAVDDVLGHLERSAALTRRGQEQRRIATEGFIAAAFLHYTSRAGDPHLHTHVVMANLVRGADGVWSCLDRLTLARYARAAGALYQSSLRHAVAQAGFPLEWAVRADGLSDVVGVPRAAIDAVSSRRRQLLADLAETPMTSARARATAAGRTRRTARPPDQGWESRAAAAGLGRAAVQHLLTSQPAPPIANGPLPDLEGLLAASASSFTHADVLAALAAASPSGAPAAVLDRQAHRFLETALPIDGTRWTTPTMVQRGTGLAEAVTNRKDAFGRAAAEAVEAAIAARRLSADGRAAVRRLTTGEAAVDVVAGASLVDQAAVVDAARMAWEASGHRVAVVADRQRAQARWHALTGLGPPPPPPARPSVVIVDRADRLSTSDMGVLVRDTTSRGAKLVLVAGGTSPPRLQPASQAMATLMQQRPALPMSPDRAGPGSVTDTVAAGRDGTVHVASTAWDAACRLTADWHQARRTRPAAGMVALGPDEAEYLNTLARDRRSAAGELTGPVLRAGDRDLQAGDEIRVLHRDRRLGVAAGEVGCVTGVDVGRMQATIQWPARQITVPSAVLSGRSVTYAYATTPAYVRPGNPGPWFALGPDAALGIGVGTGIGAHVTRYVVAPETLWRPHGRDSRHDMGDLVAALDPPVRPLRGQAGRSLADLSDEQQRLGTRLRGHAPRDVAAELRRVREDRAWLDATGAPDRQHRLADVRHREETLRERQADRAVWLEGHRDELERWAGLDAAIVWRAEALTVAAELAPSRAVTDRLGPPPDDKVGRRAWRQAAGAIETYRDRWSLPDEPLAPSPGLDAGWDRARQADRLRVLSACRRADRVAAPDRALGDDLALVAR